MVLPQVGGGGHLRSQEPLLPELRYRGWGAAYPGRGYQGPKVQ